MIHPHLAGFLLEGLGIHIGTRDDRLQLAGVRANAVKVEDDGVHVVVYVSEKAAVRILPNLEANGEAAVVFCRPTDDKSCQVKGHFVDRRPAAESERPFVLEQWERFITNLERIGISRVVAANWVAWPSVAIRLKAVSVFDQTPRPGAGAPIA